MKFFESKEGWNCISYGLVFIINLVSSIRTYLRGCLGMLFKIIFEKIKIFFLL